MAARNYELLRLNDLSGRAMGSWKAEVIPFAVPATTTYTLRIAVLFAVPESHLFEGTVVGQVRGDRVTHAIHSDEEFSFVFVNLRWRTAPTSNQLTFCSEASRLTTDLDLYVLRGSAEVFRSADFGACEWGMTAAQAGKTLGPLSEWRFRVAQFLSGGSQSTLSVEWL